VKIAIAVLLVLFFASPASASEPHCSREATEQAKKLLTFHMGLRFVDRMGFDSPVIMPAIKNPLDSKQKFNVLEVMGYVAPHGQYRMRFIYFAPAGSHCTLMGQEILEYAHL
jgi:hypothetical protein